MAGQTDEINRKNKFSKQYIQASTLQCIAAQKVTLKRPIRQQRSQPSQNPGEQISGKLHWWQRWAFCWPKVTCLNQTFCLMMFCSTWKNAMRKLEWVTFWCPQLSPPNPPPLSPPSRRAPHPTSEKVNESESKIRHFHRLLTGWYCFQKLPTYLHTYQPTYHYLSLPLPSSENTLMEHLWPLRHLIRVIRRHDLTTYLIVFSEGVFWTFDNWVVKLLASPGDRISSLFAFFDVFVISNYIYPPLVICICICICICHQQLYLLPIGHLLTQDCERWVDRTDKAFTVLGQTDRKFHFRRQNWLLNALLYL